MIHPLRVIRRHSLMMMASMLVTAAWSHRIDIARWARFARRAVREFRSTPLREVAQEIRVRAAISADSLLRNDQNLRDLRVRDGVVTLITESAAWPDPRDQIVRIKQVAGVTDVDHRTVSAGIAPEHHLPQSGV
jgi:hypothetical protein